MEQKTDMRIALLIDSENISSKYMKIIMDELNQYGKVTYKRVYGDFTCKERHGWRDLFLTFGLSPVQQYTYTKGKNATDTAMIIDAMDILYSGNVECFCLATSDSDFTRLAVRFNEAGMFVIGAGEKKTPKAFVSVCDRFFLVDALLKNEEKAQVEERPKSVAAVKDNAKDKGKKDNKPAAGQQKPKQEEPVAPPAPVEDGEEKVTVLPIEELVKSIKVIIDNHADDDGWAYLGNVINGVYKAHPEFHPKLYDSSMRPANFMKSIKIGNRCPFEFQSRTINSPNDSTFIKYV